ncbi:tripartite tricarboxylate transporter substrate binding protein BugD [Ottowia sp. GY511]|uniref:Tripartite tricarboxylate transporter substrate-binding protein n=1 Tax=Ottowia flava TaxID=2675430 RepID=A0ABW4KP08_9BURK|nr:tripartite tricarboxylate transporter substrate-binding protein [Ottowia sp. GY511]TXK26791.1 tripartite tricarboxylate transporter substrate binding protein BugD [Ottowia sp. GY511]
MRRFLRYAADISATSSRPLLRVALSACCALGLTPVLAATSDAILIVVPYAADGPTDRTLRALLKPLSRALDGATISVKNMPSPGGVNGLASVAKAAPDGKTLLFTNTNIALLPALGEKLPFDPKTDFSYLGLVLESPMVVLGRSTLAAKTPSDLVKWLSETDPAKVRLADAGAGSASFLCGLFLQSLTGKTFAHADFPGSAPAMKALKDGKVDLLCDQTPTVKGPLAAGEVQGYALTTSTPLAQPPFERLTTLRRMFSRDLELSIWHGFYAPKGLAPALQAKLNAAIVQAVADPAFVAAQEAQGVVMVRGRRLTPEGHRTYIEETIPLWHLIASISRSRQK